MPARPSASAADAVGATPEPRRNAEPVRNVRTYTVKKGDLLSKIAGWRLSKGQYSFPIEQKLFDVYVKATGQIQPGAKDYVPAVDA